MTTKKSTRKGSKMSGKISHSSVNIMDEMVENNQIDFDLTFKISHHFRLTSTQHSFYDHMMLPATKMGFVDGPAGTAKTYIAVLAALNMLRDREVDNIVYIRSIVESASKSLGFLPGEMEDKFAPWSMPLVDKLDELIHPNVASNLLHKNYITCLPVNFTRGMTFRNSCVIIDEAQNLTKNELVTLLTRFGNHSKYMIVGDTNQSDINDRGGFDVIYNAFNSQSCVDQGIHTYKFTGEDIVRSKVLRFIVERLDTIS
jgi:phosphate starvation-inducible protein PhoH and related proteins